MEKNNLSQDFFDSHIELINSNLSTWASGISFGVCYKFNVGWATAFNCDAFIININADNTLFPALDLPRDTFLTKEKIKIAIDNAAFSSAITAVNNVENLKHANLEASLADLIDFSDVNLLCLNSINLDEKTGNLTLKASAQYVNEFNSCIQGTIDLITGDKNVNDTPCFIN